MASSTNVSYLEIVSLINEACDKHLAIAAFDTGTIDFLDASKVNRKFPYVFLRPMGSLYADKMTTRTFELYSLDQPKVKSQSHSQLMSDTEQYIFDILSYFDFNTTDLHLQRAWEVSMVDCNPVNEAFQNRLFGWSATIEVVTPYILDFCSYPQQ